MSRENPMGVASGGYDIFYGVVWGTRMAFYVGLLVSVISFGIGVVIGGAAGFFGGWVDNVLMRFTDTVFAFPNLLLAIVFVTVFGPGLTNALTALALVGWTTYARILRGDILRIRELEYVDGARALGANKRRIFFRHILPNALGSLVIIASLDIGAVVLIASTLAFFGLRRGGRYGGLGSDGQFCPELHSADSVLVHLVLARPRHRAVCARLEPLRGRV